MSVHLLLSKDANGNVTYGLPVSDTMFRVNLVASTALSLVVPIGKTQALFTYSSAGDVWVDYRTTATLPTASFAATTSELRPILRSGLQAGQTLSFICEVASFVHVSFWD